MLPPQEKLDLNSAWMQVLYYSTVYPGCLEAMASMEHLASNPLFSWQEFRQTDLVRPISSFLPSLLLPLFSPVCEMVGGDGVRQSDGGWRQRWIPAVSDTSQLLPPPGSFSWWSRLAAYLCGLVALGPNESSSDCHFKYDFHFVFWCFLS